MCEDDGSKGSYLPGYLPGLCEVHQSREKVDRPLSTGVPHLVGNSTDKANSSRDKANSSIYKANSPKDKINNSIEKLNNCNNTEKANDSQGKANNSQGKANDSQGKANDSQGKANDSQGKANDSQGKANNSQGKANDSQGKVNNNNNTYKLNNITDKANKSQGEAYKSADRATNMEKANNSMDRSNNSKHKPNNSKDMPNNSTDKPNNSKDKPNSTDKPNNSKNEVNNSKVKTFKSTEKVDNSKVITFNSTNKLLSSSHLLSPIQSELSVKTITSVNSVGSSACRICHTSDRDCLLVSPCMCKGTLAYVHLSCLERWLNQNGRNYCEVCNHRYTISQTPHYGWFHGMRVWLCLPHVRRYVLVDVLTTMLLTTLIAGLITVCLIGMKYYIEEGKKLGITRFWSQGTITFFLSVVVLGYCVIVYLMFKEKVVHWHRWWRQNVEIRLVLDHMPPTVT